MNEISKIIADKILLNTLDEQSERVLQEWLELSAENREAFERTKKGKLAAIILEKKNSDFGKKMSQKVFAKRHEKEKQNRTRRLFLMSSAAALIAVSFLLVFNFNNRSGEISEKGKAVVAELKPILERDEIRLITSDGNSVAIEKSEMVDSIIRQSIKVELTDLKPEIAINTLIVPPKKAFNMVLPDGTKVWLNSGSKLIFPTQFSDTLRSVELIGEAFFDVVKNANAPFIVKTKMLETKVLGTKFMVTSYKDNSQSEVALVEGRVNVSSSMTSRNTILNAGEGVSYNSEGNNYKKIDINIEDVINRTQELFIFNDISLADITTQLSRWYDVKFEFSDTAIQKEIFYLKSIKYDKIDDIMILLKDTKKLDFTIEKNKIKIKSMMPMR